MNIEKSLDIVKGKLLMIKKLLKNDEENGHSSSYEMQKEDFEAIETLLTAYEKEKEKNKKIEIIVNKLMPLAECSYWNYENHTCAHTCRGCDYLNEDNKRTSSGILIDKDRYCRLYEDGNAEKDTKFVDVEDLIKRHLEEE